jgi:hypothetical protein
LFWSGQTHFTSRGERGNDVLLTITGCILKLIRDYLFIK